MTEKKVKETKKATTKNTTKKTTKVEPKKECKKTNKVALFVIIGIVAAAVATFLILGVCGVFNSKIPPAGDYELVDIQKDGESQTLAVAFIKSLGVIPHISVNSDKTGTINTSGRNESKDVTFTNDKIESKDSNDSIDYTYKDGKITIESDGSILVFEKK